MTKPKRPTCDVCGSEHIVTHGYDTATQIFVPLGVTVCLKCHAVIPTLKKEGEKESR